MTPRSNPGGQTATAQPHVQHSPDFLRNYLEYLPDVRWLEVEGRMGVMMDAEVIAALTGWANFRIPTAD